MKGFVSSKTVIYMLGDLSYSYDLNISEDLKDRIHCTKWIPEEYLASYLASIMYSNFKFESYEFCQNAVLKYFRKRKAIKLLLKK